MVEIIEKNNIERIIKKGRVPNTEDTLLKDDFRDFGQVDTTDHEIDETEKRYKKINKVFAKFDRSF